MGSQELAKERFGHGVRVAEQWTEILDVSEELRMYREGLVELEGLETGAEDSR